MTLSDLERRDARGQILPEHLSNDARTVDHIWQGGDGRIFKGQPRPHPKGGPQRHKFSVNECWRANGAIRLRQLTFWFGS